MSLSAAAWAGDAPTHTDLPRRAAGAAGARPARRPEWPAIEMGDPHRYYLEWSYEDLEAWHRQGYHLKWPELLRAIQSRDRGYRWRAGRWP